MSTSTNTYDKDSIVILSDIDHIRKRPGMYIGDTSNPKQLFSEIYDNALDEVINGYSDKVVVRVKGDLIQIRDFGRGIPHGKKPIYDLNGNIESEKEVLEVLLTKSFTGGKFDDNYGGLTSGTHGVGITCVNALSEYMKVVTIRNKKFVVARSSKGIITELSYGDIDSPDGTYVEFKADPEIFDDTTVPMDFIYNRANVAGMLGFRTELYYNNDTEPLDTEYYDWIQFIYYFDELRKHSGSTIRDNVLDGIIALCDEDPEHDITEARNKYINETWIYNRMLNPYSDIRKFNKRRQFAFDEIYDAYYKKCHEGKSKQGKVDELDFKFSEDRDEEYNTDQFELLNKMINDEDLRYESEDNLRRWYRYADNYRYLNYGLEEFCDGVNRYPHDIKVYWDAREGCEKKNVIFADDKYSNPPDELVTLENSLPDDNNSEDDVKSVADGINKVIDLSYEDRMNIVCQVVNSYIGNKDQSILAISPEIHAFITDTGERFIIEFAYTNETNWVYESYVNLLRTTLGGTHHKIFSDAFTDAWKRYGLPDELKGNDIFIGLRVIIAAFIKNIEFSSQTKERLTTSYEYLSKFVPLISDKIYDWLKTNPNIADGLIKRFVEYRQSKNKMLSQKTIKSAIYINNDSSGKVRRKSVVSKLAECTSKTRDGTELFIVEGDSAMGSMIQARNIVTQAILPIRGKILNVAKLWDINNSLKNEEVKSIVNAIGAGIFDYTDSTKSRYDKVIFACDGDADGQNISALLIGLFVNVLPNLVKDGLVYLAMPPLYGWEVSKDKFEFANDITDVPDGVKLTRYKGLGEMDPEELQQSMMDPNHRQLIRVQYPDDITTFNSILTSASVKFNMLVDVGVIKYIT